MRASLALFALCGALGAAAAPLDGYGWSEPLEKWYRSVGEHVANVQRSPQFGNGPSCDLSNAVMPQAPAPLPAPDTGCKVTHVAVGRGTQNYTCASSTAADIPVAIGAVANLYNASCLAANYPDLLRQIPALALQYPLPTQGQALKASNLLQSGQHFFTDLTTPTFNMDVNKDYGMLFGKKLNASTAPAGAVKGQNNQGYGAVPWLKLAQKSGFSSINFSEAYRVNTAGGNPPPNCLGQPPSFQVQYAAEYWLLTGSTSSY